MLPEVERVLKTAILLFVLAVITSLMHVKAQDTTNVFLDKAFKSISSFTERSAFEKMYIHTDKPSYLVGDTLWLKGYIFNTSYLTPSKKSGIAYVEIVTDSNKVIKRIALPVYNGLAYGQIYLGNKDFKQGGYVLRGYTNWMRNAGENAVFEKPFYIANATTRDWLLHYHSTINTHEGKDKLQLRLKLSKFDKVPVGLRELQIKLYDDRKLLGQTNIESGLDGSLDLNLNLPDRLNGKTATLSVEDKRKGEGNRVLAVPISINRPEELDLQFMPEGGELVAGLENRVAFKAIHEDGLGTSVSGSIFNKNLQVVANFHSAHKGMGFFVFTPQPGESYTARLNLPHGVYVIYKLPLVKYSGTTLKVENRFAADSSEVFIDASADLKSSGRSLLLFAHSRGVPVFVTALNPNSLPRKISISNSLFPSGITRFTLTNRSFKALNERIVFIDHADNHLIEPALNRLAYDPRDSIALQIKVTDKAGMPVKGNFSVAVTDDSQVKRDSLTEYSITNQLLLAADLRGHIEDPGYYDQPSRNAVVWQDLDCLLLTQGWTGFVWDHAFAPQSSPYFESEPEFLVRGKVTTMMNKPVPASPLTLLSKKPPLFMESVTDSVGRFVFKGIFPTDTVAFHLQARNKRNKSFNVGIEMDGFLPPVFKPYPFRIKPWYANTDTSDLKRVSKNISLQSYRDKITGNVLKEVVVKSKQIIANSKNLNGPGEADFTITKQELEAAGRTSLGELLEKTIPGFMIKIQKGGTLAYMIKDRFVHLIIDGTDVAQFMLENDSYYLHLKRYMEYFDAEEIQGIELMTNKNVHYTLKFLSPLATPVENAFLEVTTRGGVGPFMKKMIGTYIYRPIGFTTPAKFYSPRYQPAADVDMTDIRSTIYWNPSVATDDSGKATVSFYCADNPGTYSLIIEGSDLKGTLGVTRRTITVKPRRIATSQK